MNELFKVMDGPVVIRYRKSYNFQMMDDDNGLNDQDEDVLSQEMDNIDVLEDEVDKEEEEDTDMTEDEEDATWISWFVNVRGNNFFCEVDEAYIQDEFNLAGLATQVPYYEYALEMIQDLETSYDDLAEDQQELVETAAEVLYGLIHARYILTSVGMHKMYEKYINTDFGRCPRVLCQGQNVLPIGMSDVTREFSVEVFCPRCQDVYHPRSSKAANIDGAYFGTTFCHLFLLTHPELIVKKSTETYVPRIFGFRIHDSSVYHTYRENGNAAQQQKSNKAKELANGNNNNNNNNTVNNVVPANFQNLASNVTYPNQNPSNSSNRR